MDHLLFCFSLFCGRHINPTIGGTKLLQGSAFRCSECSIITKLGKLDSTFRKAVLTVLDSPGVVGFQVARFWGGKRSARRCSYYFIARVCLNCGDVVDYSCAGNKGLFLI